MGNNENYLPQRKLLSSHDCELNKKIFDESEEQNTELDVLEECVQKTDKEILKKETELEKSFMRWINYCIPVSPLGIYSNSFYPQIKSNLPGSPLKNPTIALHTKSCLPGCALHIPYIASYRQTKLCLPGNPLQIPSIALHQKVKYSLPGCPIKIPTIASQHQIKPCLPGCPIQIPSITTQRRNKLFIPVSPQGIFSIPTCHQRNINTPDSNLTISFMPLNSQTKSSLPGSPLKLPSNQSHIEAEANIDKSVLINSAHHSLHKPTNYGSPQKMTPINSRYHAKARSSLVISSISSNSQTKTSLPGHSMKITSIPTRQMKSGFSKSHPATPIHSDSQMKNTSNTVLPKQMFEDCENKSEGKKVKPIPKTEIDISRNVLGTDCQVNGHSGDQGITKNENKLEINHFVKYSLKEKSKTLLELEKLLGLTEPTTDSQIIMNGTISAQPGHKKVACINSDSTKKNRSDTLSNYELDKSGIHQAKKNRMTLSNRKIEQNCDVDNEGIGNGTIMKRAKTERELCQKQEKHLLTSTKDSAIELKKAKTETEFKDCEPWIDNLDSLEFKDCDPLRLDAYQFDYEPCLGESLAQIGYKHSSTKWSNTIFQGFQNLQAKLLFNVSQLWQIIQAKLQCIVYLKTRFQAPGLLNSWSYLTGIVINSSLQPAITTEHCRQSASQKFDQERILEEPTGSQITPGNGDYIEKCQNLNKIGSLMTDTQVNNLCQYQYLESFVLNPHSRIIQIVYSVSFIVCFGLLWSFMYSVNK